MSPYDQAFDLVRSKPQTSIFFEKILGQEVFVRADIVAGALQQQSPAASKPKLVLMSHGFRGDSLGPARQFAEFTFLLNAAGISTVRFDQPCSGQSSGLYLDSSFHAWVKTATYLAKKYLDLGYEVSLMGQSMGASTSVVVSARPELAGQIHALLLWVPDPKSAIRVQPDKIYEECGQKYYGQFWREARESDFVGCLKKYRGKVHLVYGNTDRYVTAENRLLTIKLVKDLGGQVMVLPGEDHSPWGYDHAQKVMQAELELLLT